MALTQNLGGTKPTSEQDAQKVATYNELADLFDAATHGYLSKSVAGSANVTLTTTEGCHVIMEFTGVLTGNIVIFVRVPNGTPAGYCSRQFTVHNNTTGAFALTVKTTAGGSTGVAVTQTKKRIFYHNGTNVIAAAAEV